jgi:hypothetical protein
MSWAKQSNDYRGTKEVSICRKRSLEQGSVDISIHNETLPVIDSSEKQLGFSGPEHHAPAAEPNLSI